MNLESGAGKQTAAEKTPETGSEKARQGEAAERSGGEEREENMHPDQGAEKREGQNNQHPIQGADPERRAYRW